MCIRDSAMVTMQTFLNAMTAVGEGENKHIDAAISTFDFSYLPTVIQQEKGKTLATMLLSVMERSKDVVLSDIPRQPKGDKYVFGRYSQGEVSIVKQADGRWLFNQASLRALPEILEGLLAVPAKNGSKDPQVALPFYIHLRAALPDALKGDFLLEYWQLLGIFIVVIIGFIADKAVAWFLAKNVKHWKLRHSDYRDVD